MPGPGDQEQRPPVLAPKHAGEAATVQLDRLQHLAALADPHAMLVGDVGVPDGAFGVYTDAVRVVAAEVGPRPPARQAAVGGDIEKAVSLLA
jgi:hypothetical protein